MYVVRLLLELSFDKEMEILKSIARTGIPISSNISQFDIFVDNDELLNVGGRSNNSPTNSS